MLLWAFVLDTERVNCPLPTPKQLLLKSTGAPPVTETLRSAENEGTSQGSFARRNAWAIRGIIFFRVPRLELEECLCSLHVRYSRSQQTFTGAHANKLRFDKTVEVRLSSSIIRERYSASCQLGCTAVAFCSAAKKPRCWQRSWTRTRWASGDQSAGRGWHRTGKKGFPPALPAGWRTVTLPNCWKRAPAKARKPGQKRKWNLPHADIPAWRSFSRHWEMLRRGSPPPHPRPTRLSTQRRVEQRRWHWKRVPGAALTWVLIRAALPENTLYHDNSVCYENMRSGTEWISFK